MEKGLKAFFYEFKYYLLPEDCESIEELKTKKVVEVKRLKEELCMAPNFVYESIETEILTIKVPERIFPVEVDLYTSSEYDEILRKQVRSVCQNCVRYEDDGTEGLDGHHREIALDGTCYLKETEEEPWSFSFCAKVAWNRIAKKSEELKACVDENNQEKIQEIVAEELDEFFLPNTIYGGMDTNGNYFLAFYANDYALHGVKAVLKNLAHIANHEKSLMRAEGWTVHPFMPKGMLTPTRDPDYVSAPPRIFMNEDEEGEGVNIRIYEPKLADADEETELRIGNAAYEYLCYCVGEDVFLAGCSEFYTTEEIPQDMQEVSAEELYQSLLECAKTEDGEDGEDVHFPAPRFGFAYEDEEEPEMLPFKEGMQFAMSICPEMAPQKLDESKEGGNTLFESFGIVYAYLYLPNGNEVDVDTRREILTWYLAELNSYPRPISDIDTYGYMLMSGFLLAQEGVCYDVMVFEEKAFFRWMRHLTPVLKGLNVKIVTVKRSGTVIYEPDYKIAAENADWLN